MADNKTLSVEDILAQCRRMDGAGGAAEAPPAASESAAAAAEPAGTAEPAAPAPEPPSAAPTPAAPLKKASEMSVADVLAAARAGKAAAAAPPAADPSAAPPPAAPAAPAKPAAASAAAGKKPGEMSVADILAAARGEKKAAAPAAPAQPAAAKPAAKPAAAPAAKAPAAKPAAKPSGAAAYDTASILAAARGGAKPGPMSKAEAAAKAKPAAAAVAEKPKLPPRPERPAYLQPREAAAPSSRRTFFGSFGLLLFGSSLAVGFSSLFVTNLLWVLGLARYMFPNILIEPPTVFKVGFPTDYAPGQVETKYVAQFGVWIVRYEYEGQSQIYALRTVCTHLGCTPNWLEGEQKFKCPCHGSGFYKDGVNFEGPAPRPLERFAIRLADDGQIEVDKSRKFQEELGQWQDSSSFVSV